MFTSGIRILKNVSGLIFVTGKRSCDLFPWISAVLPQNQCFCFIKPNCIPALGQMFLFYPECISTSWPTVSTGASQSICFITLHYIHYITLHHSKCMITVSAPSWVHSCLMIMFLIRLYSHLMVSIPASWPLYYSPHNHSSFSIQVYSHLMASIPTPSWVYFRLMTSL